jgi:hypothetical protein
VVIDAESLLDGVLRWAVGIVIGTLVAAVLLAAVVSVLGRRRFGPASVALSLTLIVSVAVVAIVVNRTWTGDATLYDWMWAIPLAVVAFLSGQRLLGGPRPSR